MKTEVRDHPDWLNVSRETWSALEQFESHVLKWNPAINLISKASAKDVWPRHILDSAQISCLVSSHCDHWVDLGSGGGFPSLVLAILAKDAWPACQFTFVESDSRKAAFLIQMVREFRLSAKVLVQRIEEVPGLKADFLSARALAPLDQLLGYAASHLVPSGRAYFPKGATYEGELHKAREMWKFGVKVHTSRTDSSAAVLEVDQIELL